jgi:hypothetical protein
MARSKPKRIRLWACSGITVAALWGLSGCQLSGLHTERVATSIQRPSNVAFYVRVARGNEPTAGLTPSQFTIYEDGDALNPNEIQFTLLDRSVAVQHATLLLVDTSGANQELLTKLPALASTFAATVGKTQPVYVYAFGGSAQLREISSPEKPVEKSEAPSDTESKSKKQGNNDQPTGKQDAKPITEKQADKSDLQPSVVHPSHFEDLAKPTSADPSRDLNGAVVHGLSELATKLASHNKPVTIGSLVVFTGGKDLAGRVPSQQLQAELDRVNYQVYVVDIGKRLPELSLIGRAGEFHADSPDGLEKAFVSAAERVNASYQGYYLISYCSPARAGRRKVRVEVTAPDAHGRPQSANFETRFDGTGFGDGCDAKTPPGFVVTLLFDKDGATPSAPGPVPAPATAEAPPPKQEEEKPPETTAPVKRRPVRKAAATKPAAKAAASPKQPSKSAEPQRPAGEFEP